MHVTYNVEIVPAAERDVEDLWIYIAEDSRGNATAFILRLEEQIDTLEQYPKRCPLIPENELLGTSYRHLLHGSYRTIFRITGNTVYILRIVHGSRLLDSSCFEV